MFPLPVDYFPCFSFMILITLYIIRLSLYAIKNLPVFMKNVGLGIRIMVPFLSGLTHYCVQEKLSKNIFLVKEG